MATDVLAKLFPSQAVDAPSGFSREELLERLPSTLRTQILRQEPPRASLQLDASGHDGVTSPVSLPEGAVQEGPLRQGEEESTVTGAAVVSQGTDASSEA
ncbi:hypothetical protein A1O7_04831 [Cladophialophora yegresii CBS 114405]|uniref:Uncharacterized protein n=1 Tax=Cladophialophora yegresii CBS 114405 TaxID=1182544 RepID=W9VYB1_9EURO|nr:uncharacterized protein A1O7_04831 [Cladophialophora yegresii CBS 114405]EXJ60678.1 hypothetical protein A1O7_04831 [Cladophialophora yegresii CBS 114405]